MDVPYDPACPLLIDSDDDSFASSDENIVKKYDDLLSRKMDDHCRNSENKTAYGKKPQSEARFVPAFEDDNEELLNYCLKESGILTDDEKEVVSDLPMENDNGRDMSNRHNNGKSSKEDNDLELTARTNDKEITGVKRYTEASGKIQKKKKKKKHKSKEKYGEIKGRRERNSSSERTREKKYKRESLKKDNKDKRHMEDLNVKKNVANQSEDFDDDEMFATLIENEDTFPLSKFGHDLDAEIENNQKRGQDLGKRHDKEKHHKEQSKSKHTKEKIGDVKEDKKARKKRQRSRSNQRRSKSSESDVPEKRRRKKRKHRDGSSEEEKKRYEKKKNTHDRKRKYEYENKDERNKKDKKRKKQHDRDDERKSSHKRENKVKKDSEKLHEKHHATLETNKNVMEKQRHHGNESTETRKKEIKRKEKPTKDEKKLKNPQNEHNRKQNKSVDIKGKHTEKVEKVEKKCVPIDKIAEKPSADDRTIEIAKEGEPESKVLHEKEINDCEVIPNQDKKENDVKQAEEGVSSSDTDSEFERVSFTGEEIEKESSDKQVSSPNMPNLIRADDVIDVGENIQVDTNSKLNNESSKFSQDSLENKEEVHDEVHDLSEKISRKEATGDSKLAMPLPECLQSSSSSSPTSASNLPQKLGEKNEIQSSKELEKRPFKLFSQEETNKLQKELLSKDEIGERTGENSAIEQNESVDRMTKNNKDEVDIKEENLVIEGSELQSDNEIPKSDEIGTSEQKHAQKPKDDLFDDIFAKEDSEAKNDYDIAKMYEKVDDTSPKQTSFKKQKSMLNQNSITVDAKEAKVELLESKTTTLKLGDGMDNEQVPKSPKEQSPGSNVIPGLEPVAIPGLESNQFPEEYAALRDDVETSSRIPLLFEDDSDHDKSASVPKAVELSPSQETSNRRKQPYTPPEEFTRETRLDQFDRLFHLEASDSPYNPEDLSPIDMGLTPSDASIIQREALKGTVELKLKDPFSGFENPTWQKIIEAKSKHEAKRQRVKGKDSNTKSTERVSKEEPRSSKQDKLADVLVRQSRVEQECKQVLKLYYKSKEITKEEYKNILRKAVPQVTMSNSPIIPEKIRSLMKKFVCKCKGQRLMSGHAKPERKKQKMQKTQPVHHQLTFPGEKRFRYLNPDLPMPPV